MTHSIDELTLQRCVDGELSDHEQAEFLSQLHRQDSLESWKTLALSLVEHQVFAKIFAEDRDNEKLLSFQLARPSASTPALQQTVSPTHWMHRPVRPWFSIAASLLVGMIVGVGGHFLMKTSSDADLRVATTIPDEMPQVAASMLPETMTTLPASTVQTHRPVMNVHLTGMGTPSAQPVSVPVYSPEQWESLQQGRNFQTSELPKELHQMLESQGMQVDHQHHWYRARLNDGREILVPTETMRVHHAIQ